MASRIRRGLGTLQGVTDKRAARQNLGLEDGAGSYVNADQLDGLEGDSYAANVKLADNFDLNTTTLKSGVYTGVNFINRPSGSSSVQSLIQNRVSSDWVTQKLTNISATQYSWVRSYHSGTTWGPWVRCLDEGYEQQLGVSQSWQAPGRSSGVTYTNTTAKPIMVSVEQAGGGTETTLVVDGIRVAREYSSNSDGTICAVVPPGSTYSFTGSANVRELR